MLLDTTVLVDALRGNQRVGSRLSGLRSVPLVSAISVEEILVGVRPATERAVEHLLGGVEIVPVGDTEARIAAAWRRSLGARGLTFARWDLFIAACAVTRGVPLATTNVRRFPMPELHVEHWPSE